MSLRPEYRTYHFAGHDEHVLCFGAEYSRQILIIPPLFDEMDRCRRMLVQAIRALAERGCELCCVYTRTTVYGYAAQFGDMFPSVDGHAAIHVAYFPDANHVFTLLANQQALMAAVEAWISQRFLRG